MSDPRLSHHSSRRSLRGRLAIRERSPVISTIPSAPEIEADTPLERRNTILEGRQYDGLEQNSGDELMRQPDLWFSDGSIVLRAEKTMFRVHVSQLSRHSSVFCDMLSMPQPVSVGSDEHEQGERVEGCPVLYLHDRAEDVMHLLRALYDGP